ncbi:uncharacterized protein B0T15DRAFT_149872 [Chaetomium strumarium]|uniref:Uncharacterized protein n=1 Tax=Chaetomium strumarium TaxID=1170767 RepID=A0AAJ0GV12_9PEZI|nr:hypothetical protein B0T15DRAFT_149872 [Chaetomium strumarium]
MHLLLPPLALTLALVRLTTALPLNINLGAYSPALVVGDGAISFEGEEGAAAGGGQSAEQIVNALQGAAVSGASAAAAAAAANNNNNNNGAASVTPPAVGAAAVVQIDEPSPTVVLLNDPATSVSGKELDPRLR